MSDKYRTYMQILRYTNAVLTIEEINQRREEVKKDLNKLEKIENQCSDLGFRVGQIQTFKDDKQSG